MYTCEKSIALLLEFLEGEMSEQEHQLLREHLDGCHPCVEFVASYRTTSGLCRRALAAKMPEELSVRLTAFLRARMNKP
jgi:anti-sigma factor RsiW